MVVVPYLPRHGTPYIPRPPLDVSITDAGAGSYDFDVSGITKDIRDGRVTLRVYNGTGSMVHESSAPHAIGDESVSFQGVVLADPGPPPYSVAALTDNGQIGREALTQDSIEPPAIPILTSISPSTFPEGSTPRLSIRGAGFASGDTIHVGQVIIPPLLTTPVYHAFDILPGIPAGTHDVTVENANGTSNALTLTVEPAAPPVP